MEALLSRKLSGTETIRDILPSLANAEEYVRNVLGHMASFKRRQVDPVVRIGSTGEGIVPHYRIEPNSKKIETLDDFDAETVANDFSSYVEHMAAFNGRSHKKMDWGAFNIRGEHWSSGAMNFVEVQSLLGELRSGKKNRDFDRR
jgi:hypothetical protein